MPVVGYLSGRSYETSADFLSGFRRGLKDSGYVEGENVIVVYRWAENQFDRLPALATELVHRGVTAIAASGGSASAIAGKATTAIPIVFMVPEDPVKLCLIANLAPPGGHLTRAEFFSP